MRVLVSRVGMGFIVVSFVGLALLAAGPGADVPTQPRPAPMAAAQPAEIRVDTTAVQAAPETASAVPAEPTAEPSVPLIPTVLDEDFADNRMGWPDNSARTAWLAPGAYHLAPQEPPRFVAVGAPLSMPVRDVVISARFRKLGGPPGGGYGLIVRDQAPLARDGVRQDGHYYVLEVGDRGEVGIWRRDDDAWVDLLPWTLSGAVQPGGAANDLEVWATGSRLSLLVNGVLVASRVDDLLPAGGVGVFVGGDGNNVAIERLVVRVPLQAAGVPAIGTPQAAPSAPLAAPPPGAESLPITRLVIPGISLDTDVVPAELSHSHGSLTWEVPAFKVGHAQTTAGAGGPGNAVLVGHVTSRNLGNVFEDLRSVRVGDNIQVFSGPRRFEYRAVDVRTVPRSEVDVVRATAAPSITLLTCTGLWLPVVSDYAERLVVRAELIRADGS